MNSLKSNWKIVSETAHDRLYNHAKKQRDKIERKRKEAREEDVCVNTNTLTLKSNWNIDSANAAHNRLYNHAKKQKDKIEFIRMEARDEEEQLMENVRGDTRSERETDLTSSRLYNHSFKKQMEGKKLRESIERKLAPRAPTPSGKIRADQACMIYERGMIQKLALEMKREEETMTKSYVSPLLDPLVYDQSKPALKMLANKNTASSRIRPRSRLRSNSNPDQVKQIASSIPSSKNRAASTSSSFKHNPSRASTPTARNSRWSTPMKKVPNTRTRSPTPARHRYDQNEIEDRYY